MRTANKTRLQRHFRNNSRRSQMMFESLEDRRLMAADIDFTDGILTIQGDSQNDYVELQIVQKVDPALTLVGKPGQEPQLYKTWVVEVKLGHMTPDSNTPVFYETASEFAWQPGVIDQIVFQGALGNDVFHNNTDIASLLYGGSGNDELHGGSIEDYLNGGPGSDLLYGHDGDDMMVGSWGSDTLDGGLGKDSISEIVLGHAFLNNTSLTNMFYSWNESDSLNSVEKVTLQGTWYGNYINASQFTVGNVELYGNSGNDVLIGSSNSDYLDGGSGNDMLLGNSGFDTLKGGEGNDKLYGGSEIDTLQGGSGDDKLYGNEGADKLDGNSGNDTLYAGSGNDTLEGGSGNDKLHGQTGNNTLKGGSGNDTLHGGSGDETLYGEWGNDTLIGNAGHDFLYGGSGNDTLKGGSGHDRLYGGLGNDTLKGDSGDDTLVGGWGNDVILGGDGFDHLDEPVQGEVFLSDNSLVITISNGDTESDFLGAKVEKFTLTGSQGDDFIDASAFTKTGVTLLGEGGHDTLIGTPNNDLLKGGEGNDILSGEYGADELYGDDGLDILYGGYGNDTLYAGLGNDTLHGGNGHDSLYGGEGNNILKGDSGDDTLMGGAGDDTLEGGSGEDTLSGQWGDDTLRGGSGNDVLYGEWGADTLYGDGGNDIMFGGTETDIFYGGSGDDQLLGGAGIDILFGEGGNDGMFGGTEIDLLVGGDGMDRYLYQAGDVIWGYFAEDVKIEFLDTTEQTTITSDDEDHVYSAAAWSDTDVQVVDEAFAVLQQRRGDNTLLRTSDGSEMQYLRLGATSSDTVAWNSGEVQKFSDRTFDEGDNWAHQVVYHEIGHNWDDENPDWDGFKKLSGWTKEDKSDDAKFTLSTDKEWCHLTAATFARDYGKDKPTEDFASSFAAYFMDYSGETFQDGEGATKIPKKIEFLDDFLDDEAFWNDLANA